MTGGIRVTIKSQLKPNSRILAIEGGNQQDNKLHLCFVAPPIPTPSIVECCSPSTMICYRSIPMGNKGPRRSPRRTIDCYICTYCIVCMYPTHLAQVLLKLRSNYNPSLPLYACAAAQWAAEKGRNYLMRRN